MNKRQLAAFARSKGWQGDDARTPLSIIVQWLRDRGHDVATAQPSQPAPQPVQPGPSQGFPGASRADVNAAVAASAQPAPSQPVHAPVIEREIVQPQPAPSTNPLDAYIEQKIAEMIDAAAAATPTQPAQPMQPTLNADAIRNVVSDTLRAMFPQSSPDAPYVELPADALASLAAAAVQRQPASVIFKSAVARNEVQSLEAFTVPTLPPCSRTPSPDPTYQFDAEALRLALICESMQPTTGRLWLAGAPGSGKTQFALQYAALTGRPLYRVNFEGSVERYELIGGEKLEAGSSVWKDGALTQAIQVPYAVILLDEPTFCRAHNMASLHSLLERDGAITLTETGRVIRPAVGVFFILADNTLGQGDTTGQFAGVVEQNKALINRMTYSHVITPPTQLVEARLLTQRTGIHKDAAKLVAKFSEQCRRANETGALVEAVSLRQTEAFCHALKAGIAAQSAFTVAIVNKASMECAEALQQLFAAHLGDTLRGIMNEPVSTAQPAPSPDGMSEQGESE